MGLGLNPGCLPRFAGFLDQKQRLVPRQVQTSLSPAWRSMPPADIPDPPSEKAAIDRLPENISALSGLHMLECSMQIFLFSHG